MRGKTAWLLGASTVQDFQIGTLRMWECWRTGGLAGVGDPDLQRRPQAGTRDAQCRFRGWVEIAALSVTAAAIERFDFPPSQD